MPASKSTGIPTKMRYGYGFGGVIQTPLRTAPGGGTPTPSPTPTPTPLLEINFATGVYKLAGTTHPLEDLIDSGDLGDTFDPAGIQPGVGLVVHPETTADYRANGSNLTALAATDILPSAGGFTAVMDYRLEGTSNLADGGTDGFLSLALVVQTEVDGSGSGQVQATHVDSTVQLTGADNVPVATSSVRVGSNHKIAVTFTEASTTLSVDGEATITMAGASHDSNRISLNITAYANAVQDQTGTLRSVKFYAPVDDADLLGLSA